MEFQKFPTDFFPSYDKWMAFLRTQPPEQVDVPLASESFLRADTTYRTPFGVHNSLYFLDHNPQISAILKPEYLTQKYRPLGNQYQIEVGINNRHISSDLDIPLDSTESKNTLTKIEIMSKDSWTVVEGWVSTQEIFMRLNEDYLKKLKAAELVQDNAGSRIWVRQSNGVVEATIDGSVKNEISVLDEEVLRRICHDADLEYQFDMDKEETRGKIGNISFNLHHARAQPLDQDRIWKALTGTNPDDPFIFPVNVEIKNEA